MRNANLLGILLLLPLTGLSGVPQAGWFACGVLLVSATAAAHRPSVENSVFLLALTLRLVAEAVIPYLGLPQGYLSDAHSYDVLSYTLEQATANHALLLTLLNRLPLDGTAAITYAGELALWHAANGSSASFTVLNALFCALAASAYAATGRLLFGTPSAWAGGLLAAALPSAVLYGGMALRDSQIQLAVAGFLLFTVHAVQSRTLRAGVVALGLILLTLAVRWYLVLFAGAAAGAWLLLSARTLTFRQLAIRTLATVLALGLLAGIADHTGYRNLPQSAADFRTRLIQKNAEVRSDDKIGSALYLGNQIPDFASLAEQLPRMAATVGFSPLPGGYHKPGFATKAAQGENLLLLCLLLLALPGAIAALPDPAARVPFLWFLVCFFAYGLVEPDMGAAIRHKAQFWPAIAIYAPRLWVLITKNNNKGLPV